MGQMLVGTKEECSSEEELFEESGFSDLGYNTMLQQDEAAGFVAFMFAEKKNALQRLEAMPIDKSYAQRMASKNHYSDTDGGAPSPLGMDPLGRRTPPASSRCLQTSLYLC